ncbi:alpha/beta fold hydrolase [Nocardiopsis alborubida]|uniref:Alpha/beta hydrolase n=1 Tax=Nocardiopsis alborubida TaxID=146802 RepID=A0A7X6RNU3_9ACTN|nr:alpha/beta hydrolase [Nocardiopsis alborubida]NKY97150.1 alpha/beta hydrolase [Nocardiopsis alborubida]
MSAPQADPLDDVELARSLDGGFSSRHADVNGVRLHYVEGGSGTPLLLLGGWPQTWWQWHRVMPALARRHRVIAVDLRGMGGSSKPAGGYDKKTMARDVRELVRHLGLESVDVVGHDIGAMVAYAYAANHPEATRRICMLDVAHPDDGWSEFRLLPEPGQPVNTPVGDGGNPLLWWFAFNQVLGLPEELLEGRTRVLVDWLAEHVTKDPGSIDERSREVYARALSSADAVRAGNAWYRAFNTDIADERTYAPVSAPILVLGGELSNHASLREVMPAKGTDVRVVRVDDSGHYVPEEQPGAVIDALESFLA